ncbi:MAG: TlyA family RNA methyltransferase [bacterium]|nr:TlyA family RNA methyltransferase [bacterium]
MTTKNRLDKETVNRDLIPSIEKAKAMIMAGEVLVSGQVVYKADTVVTNDHIIELKKKSPYASRGALKIETAFNGFSINVKGLKTLDIGISNGGFTDYMLQKGAEYVTGVDVNIQQVDEKLRNNKQVKLIKTNARTLTRDQLEYEPDIITIDVSFISVTKILPALTVFRKAKIICLIKPQFEAQPKDVGKGGIIRDKRKRLEVLTTLNQRITEMNYGVTGFTASEVKGRKGNREYFFLLEYGKIPVINDTILSNAIKSEI